MRQRHRLNNKAARNTQLAFADAPPADSPLSSTTCRVRFALVGLTTRLDVVDLLEKRLRSRFSHRQFLLGPLSPDEYQEVSQSQLPRELHGPRAPEQIVRALRIAFQRAPQVALTALLAAPPAAPVAGRADGEARPDATPQRPPRSPGRRAARGRASSQSSSTVLVPSSVSSASSAPAATAAGSGSAMVRHVSAVRELMADPAVLGVLRRWQQLGRPVRQLLEWMTAAVSLCIARAAVPPAGEAASGLLRASDLLQAAEALTVRPILRLLPDLSPLELSLLAALAHIEEREDAAAGGAVVANFEMVQREYSRFTRAQGAGTLAVHRDVALKAFERLMSMGFIVFTGVAADASAAIKSAAHMSRHCQLVRLSMDPGHVVEAVRGGEVQVPTALRHWILHGEQT